jgi:hypothetical protein
MRTRARCTAMFWYWLTAVATPAVAQVDQERAQQYFREVQALCERDGGRLWGVPVCGPMVIGDMRTQTFATSQPAPGEARPRMIGLVNAPITWGGVTWGAYKGVLIASDGGSRRVSAPVRRDAATVSGDGWTFKAAPGSVVRDGARPGDYEGVRL